MGTSDKSSSKSAGQRKHSNVKTLGRYVVDKKIGEGGMGCVYRATDQQLERTVALKVLPLEKASDPRLVKRFKQEAQAAAALKHKNIVGVYDSGEIDGFLYIAMEYIDGIDVHELVKRKGVLDIRRSRDIMKQLARALQHAYEQNIVHRDIKPSNLLIDRDGKVRLADMGLARSLDDSEKSGITRAGTTVGTVDYMSPEQTRDSRAADTRSDMYSLGATWYYLLTGQAMFPDGDLLNRINAHATNPPPNPQDLNEEVPHGVVEVMHRMLEKKPEDRFQTPDELLEAIETMSMKKSSELDMGLLAALAEEDDDEPRRKRPKKKKRAVRKEEPSRPVDSFADIPEEVEDSSDDVYGFQNANFDESEPDDEPGSDMGIPLSEGTGDVNLGLLAALAEEDDGEDVAATPARRKSAGRSKSSQSRSEKRSTPKQRPSKKEPAREPAPKSKSKPKPEGRSSKPKKRPRREASRSETSDDHAETDDNLPSRRDLALGRGSRHGRTGSSGSAVEQKKEMIAIVGIIVVVCVLGWIAMNAMSGGDETVPTEQPAPAEQ